MLWRWLLLVILPSLAFAACKSGGGTGAGTPTAATSTTAAAATPSPSPTRAPVPDRPAALNDYALAVAAYLSSDAAAAGECLRDLYAAWDMPAIKPGAGCTSASTDADPADEIVAVFTAAGGGTNPAAQARFEIAVFDRTDSGYGVAFETQAGDVLPPGTTAFAPVLAAGDLLGDGAGALAYTTGDCGASTCSVSVHVVRGTASGYASLTAPEGITMATADAKVVDAAGGGAKEIELTGGEAGSVGAGPQRQRTETWAWDGSAYVLKSTTLAKPVYLYHAIKDADALFAAGRYADAEAAYLAAVDDKQLKEWMPEKNERNELDAYALFRAGVAELLGDGRRDVADGYLARAGGYAGTLHHQLAGSFQAAYAAKADVSVACSAVRDDLNANIAEYTAFWDFGYGNPAFDPAAVCPI